MPQRPTPLEWDVAVVTGLVRVAAGTALLRGRRRLMRLGGAADTTSMHTLFGYFGVRDIAVGVSTLAATRPGGDVPRQLMLQGLADSTDAVLVAAAVRSGAWPGWKGRGAVALAAGTAALEFLGVRRLRSRAR